MNKTFKLYVMVLGLVLVVSSFGLKTFADSRRTSGTTTGTILVDPKPDGTAYTGTSIEAVGDTLATASGGGSQVKVFARNPNVGKIRVTTALTTATTTSNIICDSTSGLNVNDVVYCVPAGVSYTGQQKGFVATITVIGAGGTNAYASAVLTTNLSAGSYVYPLTTVYDAFVGSNTVNRAGSAIFETAGDSPLRIILNSTGTNDLSVTFK